MLKSEIVEIWLRNYFGSHSLPVVKCLMFGSILHSENPNDIDIIIVFNEWDIRDFMSQIKKSFKIKFKFTLNVQIFHISQDEIINLFLKRAAPTREIL